LGFFAKVKSFFTPKKQAAPKAVSDFNGVSSTRFYGQKYSGGLPQPTPTLILDSAGIRQQVRTLSHNSLQLRALIERDVDTVIAQGLNLSPEPKHKILGLSPEAAKEWIGDVKTRFELWAMSQKSNRSARYNFYQAQRLMRKSLFRDGELFVALSYHNDPSLLSPLRFEILDPDQIRESGYTWTGGANLNALTNKQGIIRNADGEETAYKVWGTDAAGIPRENIIPRVGRSGRIMMLHAMTGIDYAGQLRGVSPFAVCVQDLEHILDFTIAQVNKAINQSNVAFTVESETDEPAVNPLIAMPSIETRPAFGNGPAVKQYGSDPRPDPGAENVTEESLQPVYTEIPHGNFNKPGSYGVFSLPGKQKLKPFPDTSPSQAFNVFIDAYFAYIAATTGESVETVLMRFNNNYSASRATLILTWRIAEQRRWELDYYILGPAYEMWLSEEIAAGRISAPGWADPRMRAAWTAHRYNGLSMPNIDPERTAKAAKEYLSVGATTLEDTAIEYNDSDAESNRIKLKQELAELREIGAMPWSTGTNSNKGGDSDNDEDDDDNDNNEGEKGAKNGR
jgi:capsid protein